MPMNSKPVSSKVSLFPTTQLLFIPLVLILFFTLNCSHSNNIRKSIEKQSPNRNQLIRERNESLESGEYTGFASYYGEEFHGRPTASGEIFDMNQLTAAHRSLPFGTICRITNIENGKSVIVRINDRGPWIESRIIDLSKAAAEAIGGLNSGVIKVKIDILEQPK
ncbi:MAG: hypothetical protein Kow0042_18740 [Calditrichia bacterium]